MDNKYGDNIIDFLRYLEKFVKSLTKDNKIEEFKTFDIKSLLYPGNKDYFGNLSKFLLAVISARIGSNFINEDDIFEISEILKELLGDELQLLPYLSYEELYVEIVYQVGEINGTVSEIIEAIKVTIDFLSTFEKVSQTIDRSNEKQKLLSYLSAPVNQLDNSVSGVFNVNDYTDIQNFFNELTNENNKSPDSNISILINDFQSLLNILESQQPSKMVINDSPRTQQRNGTTEQQQQQLQQQGEQQTEQQQKGQQQNKEPYYSKDRIIKVSGPSYVFTPSDCNVSIQVGIPPDTLKRDQSICHFIVPHFLISKDVSLSEVEFPIFYNKFVQKGKTKVVIICTDEQKQRIETILTESIFGPAPQHIYTNEEITIPDYKIDLLTERLAIDPRANDETLDSYVMFKTFDSFGIVDINLPSASDPSKFIDLRIRNTKGLISFHEDHQVVQKHLKLQEQDKSSTSTDKQMINTSGNNVSLKTNNVSVIDSTIESQYVPVLPFGNDHEQVKKFKAPTLGVTFLGVSHGLDFAHCSHTTGFIIWINGSGVVVDPPVGNTTYLQTNGIYGKTVEHIILTHCHADHDSGILQKIIERNKVTLYTTKTINESYMRKLKALTGLPEQSLKNYYTWVPVTIGNKIKILGAEFEFDYSFHVIPTIRFKLEIYNKKISYSADTFYDLQKFKQLKNQGILTKKRIERLKSFVFDADMIIHESGVAPIHTPITNLLALPAEIRKKIRVVHCSSSVDTKGEIIRPKEGLENTETIKVDRKYKGVAECIQIQTALNHCSVFSKLSPVEVQRVFFLCKKIWVKCNDIIIKKGSPSDMFYIILSGKVLVYENEYEAIKSANNVANPTALKTGAIKINLCAGETLGESALQLDKNIDASATVIAETDVCLLVWKTMDLRTEFHSNLNTFISKVHMDLSHINSCRDAIIRAFQHNITQHINKEEVDIIANGSKDVSFAHHQVIFSEGDISDCMYIIKQGRVRIHSKKNKNIIRHLNVGDFFGETAYRRSNDDVNFVPTRSFTATASDPTILLKLDGESIVNPRIQNIIEQKAKKNAEDNIRYHAYSPKIRTPRTPKRVYHLEGLSNLSGETLSSFKLSSFQ
ncbi:hypothetical protein RB653_002636 [Dictyostelium firmibasis]|uniref:3',5'-cyclic-GMP phosphodiesterase n=1 Tax=Dictyostelium firmibasis TaxID=79012 RepID=A0AAN7TXM1_9MYCE